MPSSRSPSIVLVTVGVALLGLVGCEPPPHYDALIRGGTLYDGTMFDPGQIQIVNNRRLAHRRTAFVDWPEPDRRRHLIRIWLRDHGRSFYLG